MGKKITLYSRKWSIDWEAGEFLIATLTESGIIATNSLTGEIVESISNDNKIVKLLREAKAIWDNDKRDNDKDKEEFLTMVRDKSKREDFTVEENIIFRNTDFTEDNRCISVILAEIREDNK